MLPGARIDRPHAVLFACGMNSIRSVMAEALFRDLYGKQIYVASAGVRKGEVDPFVIAAMKEMGIDASKHKPHTFEELEEWEGFNFDLVISLAPEAHHKALDFTRTMAVAVEYWPTADPSVAAGNREQRLDAYRECRDQLFTRIRQRFTQVTRGNE